MRITAIPLLLATLLFAHLACAVPVETPDVSAMTGSYFHKKLEGSIGDKLSIVVDIKNVDGVLTGTYRYVRRGEDLYLRGTLDASGNFRMQEYSAGKVTGTLMGVIEAGSLTGTWQSPDGRRTLRLQARQTSEIHIGSKHEILSAAVGHYPLATISGVGGANAMWDTWQQKERWFSNVSGISAARRVSSDINLSRADKALLDSLHIAVEPDLTVRLKAGQKVLLEIPYVADGMDYHMDQSHSEVAVGFLQPLSANASVHDEQLYLSVRDGVDYTGALGGSFFGSEGDIAVLSYSIIDKTLQLTLVEGSCCGSSIWTFGPRRPAR